jgi:hypothetical protein
MKFSERRKIMELIKFILWLTAGAIIGWFASRIVSTERVWARNSMLEEESSSVKS